jgi:hypothetical protein
MRDLSPLQDLAFIGRRCLELVVPLSRYQQGLYWSLGSPLPLLHIKQLLLDFIVVSLVLKWSTEGLPGIQQVPIFDLHGEFGELLQLFEMRDEDPSWVLLLKKETKVFDVFQYFRMHGLLSEDYLWFIELFVTFILEVNIAGLLDHFS